MSARISKEMEKEVEVLMREEHLEKSAALRKILRLGLEHHRRERALELLSRGEVTLGRAAEIAQVSIWEMYALAASRRIAWVDEDVTEDLRAALR